VADCNEDAQRCDAFDDAVCVPVAGFDGAQREDVDEDGGVVDEDAGFGGTPSEGVAMCFERCTVGADPEDKCHGRADVACEALSDDAPTDGFCRPLCASDADCEDRSCDVRTGACVDAPSVPDTELGRKCSRERGADGCSGLCVSLSDDYNACGHRCAFGQPGDCAPLQSAAPRGGCLFTSPMGTIGDIGFCAELCDCAVDCSHPDAICDGFTDPELARVFGRAGVCTPPELVLGEALECD
jgi:hypothetical protein